MAHHKRKRPKRIFSYGNYAMNPYYNLSPEQRRVQQLADQFNADEQLWRSLGDKRRIRRKILRHLSAKHLKQLDLLEFANARPPQDCIGWFVTD